MINYFRLSLLNEILTSDQQKLLDPNSEVTFRKLIKIVISGSQDDYTISYVGNFPVNNL
jgi:hypothetical protein